MAFSDQPDHVDISALKIQVDNIHSKCGHRQKVSLHNRAKHCSVIYLSSYAKTWSNISPRYVSLLISITLENRTSMIVKYFLVIIDFFD